MTPEQLKRFDEASEHPYECKCDLCKEWWSLVPPEDEDYEPPMTIRNTGDELGDILRDALSPHQTSGDSQ